MQINPQKILKNCFTFIRSHIFTILCVALFFIISSRFEYFLYQKKQFLFSSISLVFVMHLFSRMRFNIIFTVIFSLIVATNFYFAFALNTYLNSGIFSSIMETNMGEAQSMSKDIFKQGIPMLLLCFTLIFLSMKELKTSIVPLKYSLICLLISVIIIIPYNMQSTLHKRLGGMQSELTEYPLVVAELTTQRVAPILYGNVVTIINYIDERLKYRNFFNTANKILADGISYNTEAQISNLPQKIYLIIGESATRNRLSLYGYHHPTSPYVDSLAINDINFKVYEGYTSGTITRDAFRMILTASSPHDMSAFFSTQSLVDMANNANRESVWISPLAGAFRQSSGTYIQLLASSAQNFIYSSQRDDLYLPKLLLKAKKEDLPQFILIGLNGSHAAYKGGTDEIDEKSLPNDESLSTTDNDYNRSIHHTDRLLKEMHEIMLQDSSSVMLYASDHGEIIGKGHGMTEGRAQIEIPLMTFNNSAVDLDAIISKYTYITDNDQGKALNSLSLFYVIAELMGYTVSEEAIQHVLTESKYVYFADRTVGLASEMKDGQNVNAQ